MKKILIFTFIIVLSCKTNGQNRKQNLSLKTNSGFSFKITGLIDIIDSKKGTLFRQYNDKNVEVPLEFNEIELQKIESLYIKLKLDTLPNNYEPNCVINIIPTFYDEFEIIYKGLRKQFIYNSHFECIELKSKQTVSNIEKFWKLIYEIIHSREKVRKLEHSDIIFE